jgi:tetratricopeptide (TPR) repeat protein
MRGGQVAVTLAVLIATATAVADPQAEQRERSGDLNRQAEIAFNQGNFEQAAKLLEFAYEAYPDPTILYNLGKTYERLGAPAKAAAAYRRYLEALPQAPDRATVEQAIAELDAKARARSPIPPAPPPESPLSTRPARPPSKLPWIVVGTGGALTSAGVVFGFLVARQNRRSDDAASQARAITYAERAERYEKLELVGLIGGGALLAGGLVWAILDRRAAGPRSALHFEVGPGAVSAAVTF